MNAPLTPFLTRQAAPAPAAIALEGVTKTFRPQGGATTVTALSDVSLALAPGEILGVIGRSGAGKSTLVRVVNGLEQPTAGRVLVDGVVMSGLAERQARDARRRIGMVFQHFNLLSSRTAADNVALPLEIAGVPAAQARARVQELLGLVGLGEQRDRYPSELSGGQKQRVGIARALATRPSVLLSDEATSALDPETSAQILDLLARIRRDLNVTILLITHEMSVVKAIADRVAVLDAGHIVEAGPTFEVFAHPRHETTRAFVGTVTGAALPPSLKAVMTSTPREGGQTVLRIVFSGPAAGRPILSRLSQLVGVDVNIVAGRIDEIAARPFGTLIVTVPSAPATVAAVTAALEHAGLGAEVLGHVA